MPADAAPGADDVAAAALAGALQALKRDEARARRLGQRNLERIQRDGRRETQMDAMSALYRQLLGQRRVTVRGGR